MPVPMLEVRRQNAPSDYELRTAFDRVLVRDGGNVGSLFLGSHLREDGQTERFRREILTDRQRPLRPERAETLLPVQRGA